MIDYKAPNPYPKPKGLFSLFVGLSSLSASSSTSVSQSIGTIILPAQLMRIDQTLAEFRAKNTVDRHDVSIDCGFISTHDNAQLETIEITPTGESDKDITTRKFIIKYNGNGGQFQNSYDEYARDANRLQLTVIGFNYRGVGNSTPSPTAYRELITDGIAQVQRCLDLGADATNITLDGISLGGSVATMVAKYFHDKGERVSLWNDRSFSTLSNAAGGFVAPDIDGIVGDVLATSSASLAASILVPSSWQCDVASAYKSIPSEYKGYMVVSKPSGDNKGDGVIAHRASLHCAVKNDQNTAEHAYKVLPQMGVFGHNERRSALISKQDQTKTGQELFEAFVTRQSSL